MVVSGAESATLMMVTSGGRALNSCSLQSTSVVASGVIGLEAGKMIGVHLERKSCDFEPLLGRRPTRENTHKRAPTPSFARLLSKHFEKNRARGTRLNAFHLAMETLSK